MGRAYNQAFKIIEEDDFLCVHDWDVQFLLPESIAHLYGYAERYPDCVLTCLTNRNHVNMKQQLLNGTVSENTDYKYHYDLAVKQTEFLYEATEIKGSISGFLMLISKKLWSQVKFPENMKCLGVDMAYSRRLREQGKKIMLMKGIYVFHSYRIINGVQNRDHLL